MHNMQIYPIDMQLVFDTSVTDVTEYGIISSTHQPFDETRVDATPVDTDSGFSVHRPDHSNKVLDQRPTRAQRKHSVILAPKRKGRRQHTPSFDRTPSELMSSSPHTSSASSISSAKPYHCTVCCKSFAKSYEWKRHESSVHGYNNTEWVCMLGGLTMAGMECVFCSDIVDDFHHFDDHDMQSCLDKSMCDRTFARKDLLKQHVQQKHLANAEESVSKAFQIPEAWSQEVHVACIKKEALWCGFCLSSYNFISERMDHVAEHFRKGDDIEAWIPHTIM
jgi:hypothetical protein